MACRKTDAISAVRVFKRTTHVLFYCSLDFLNYNRTGIHFISWKNSCKTCNTAELDSEGTHAPITATFLPTRRGSLFLPFGCGGSLWAPSDGTPRDQALVRPSAWSALLVKRMQQKRRRVLLSPAPPSPGGPGPCWEAALCQGPSE